MPRWTDERVDQIMGSVLRAGVLMASALVAAGAAIYLARHGGDRPDYGVFRGEPPELCGIPGILRAALGSGGRGLIQLGLLALVATPVARVVFALIAFAVQRDRIFVAVSLVVLGALLYSLFGAPL